MESKIVGLTIIVVILLVFSLYWLLKARKLEDMLTKVDEITNIQDLWDRDYRAILNHYGTIDNFIEAHEEDFDTIRSNLLIFIENLETYQLIMKTSLTVLYNELDQATLEEDGEELRKKVKSLVSELDTVTLNSGKYLDRVIDDTKQFVEEEAAAHKENVDMDKVMEQVKKSEHIKDVNFFDV